MLKLIFVGVFIGATWATIEDFAWWKLAIAAVCLVGGAKVIRRNRLRDLFESC